MPRYIDADALIISLVKDRSALVNFHVPYGELYRIDETIWKVVEAPTADVVPVVRGEWIEAKHGVMSVWPEGQVMCSVCEQRMPSQWKKMPPYCYGCGAKMEDKPCG